LAGLRQTRRGALHVAGSALDDRTARFISGIARRRDPGADSGGILSAPPLGRAVIAPGPEFTYLNHAAAGVLPIRTRDVLVEIVEGQARAGVLGFVPVESNLPAYRERIGAFVGAHADEIAFLRNTGDGANTIARGLAWRAGDEVIICDNEFGSNALPWLALREFGVVVKFVETARERMTPEVLEREIGPRTRLVAVSWVSFSDGYRHDLAALSALAHARGALFCVDAIQALGAFPLDVRADGIDALYAGGAKWLLALPGVSFLYVSRALQQQLTVRWRGWRDVIDIWNFFDYEQDLAPSAARYEGGTQNFLGIAALDASMSVLAEAGVERIAAHVLALTDRLTEGLLARGAAVHSLRARGTSSGIVTFTSPGRDPVEQGRALGREGFVTTYRPSGIRVSPHGYNTADEIDAFLARI
jgi:selenocysteine lyase/cysteine desulfurase